MLVESHTQDQARIVSKLSREVWTNSTYPNLIHNRNSRRLDFLIQRLHSWRHIRRSDYMFLRFDSRLHHSSMVCIGYQGYYDVVFGYGIFQSGRIIYIEADGLRVGRVAGELLGGGQRTAGHSDVHAGVGEDLDGRGGDEAGAEEEGGLRHCNCDGLVQQLSWYSK